MKKSVHENGHAKIISNLVTLCKVWDSHPEFKPGKVSLSHVAMAQLLLRAKDANDEVNACKNNYDRATNARESVMRQLRPITTRIVNSMLAQDVEPQTIDDARKYINKIRGSRARKKKNKDAAIIENQPQPKPARRSVSQQSTDMLIENFGKLTHVAVGEINYKPFEVDIQVEALQKFYKDMEAANAAVKEAWVAYQKALQRRNEILYGKKTGVVDTAKAAKAYVVSVFGVKSSEAVRVNSLSFKAITERRVKLKSPEIGHNKLAA